MKISILLDELKKNFLENSALNLIQNSMGISSLEAQEKLRKDNSIISKKLKDKINPFFNKRGWYITGQLDNHQILELENAIGDIDAADDKEQIEMEIEQALIKIMSSVLTKKEKDIYSAWPKRKKILQAAINSHKSQNYILSIPVFLAQSDGICFDIFGIQFFTRTNGKTLSEEIRAISNSKVKTPLMRAFLDLLSNPSSMTSSTKNRDKFQNDNKFYGPVNRHGILHGLDLEYDSEANSLRCISLLFFLANIQNSYLMDEE